ncbi:C-terminal kinesin/UFD1-like protein CDC48 co-factor [Perkinsela sp. CCAP 1560/4]|nr:C-terminal kinesin/UFD1-like protein CDC48 co-factor [Perkinsela sp. CCAP 1560/4]|eukprot:KNH09475.1 C-terminal kinesin/UFD1-like protein CDC48 co-factor [Perkinsela sp. CCAP 1560/4]
MTYKFHLTGLKASTVGNHAIERGGNILLPESVMRELLRFGVEYPFLFRISRSEQNRGDMPDSARKHIYCGVLEFTAQENTAVLPNWVFNFLEIPDLSEITIEKVVLRLGKYVKIRPLEETFLLLHNPKAVLEYNLAQFSALTKGTVLEIYHNNKPYHIEICEIEAREETITFYAEPEAICIIDVDVELEIEHSEINEPERQIKKLKNLTFDTKPNSSVSENVKVPSQGLKEFIPFTCSGKSLSGAISKTSPKTESPPRMRTEDSVEKFVPFQCNGRSLKEYFVRIIAYKFESIYVLMLHYLFCFLMNRMNNQKRTLPGKAPVGQSKPDSQRKSVSSFSNRATIDVKRQKCDVSDYKRLQGEYHNFKKESEKVAFDVTTNERKLVQKVSELESLLESEQQRLKEFQELAAGDQSEREAKISVLTNDVVNKEAQIEFLQKELETCKCTLSEIRTALKISQESVSLNVQLLERAIVRFQDKENQHYEGQVENMYLEMKNGLLMRNNLLLQEKLVSISEESKQLRDSTRLLQERESIHRETIETLKNSVRDARNVIGTTQGSLTTASEREKAKDILILEGERARRKLLVQMEEMKGNIRVYCRVRPLLGATNRAQISFPDHIDHRIIEILQKKNNATSTIMIEKPLPFKFDRVFDLGTPQEKVFENIESLVESAVDGYRVCILAYGQTGSGKTHTMEGTLEQPGVIPRAFEKIFEAVDHLTTNFEWEFSFTCTYIEIYNDIIRDLLVDSEDYRKAVIDHSEIKHEIRHDGKTDTSVTGVRVVSVHHPYEVEDILKTAKKNRTTARTKLNERSSRSHSVFTVKIDGKNAKINQTTHGVLCLIDLAGSERVADSGALGVHFKEAVNINRSLSHLGDVIAALGAREKSSDSAVESSHIPFRNCKLTYLLQNFLGGEGSKVLLLVNVSPVEEHIQETISSLRFAAKVNSTSIGAAKKRNSSF